VTRRQNLAPTSATAGKQSCWKKSAQRKRADFPGRECGRPEGSAQQCSRRDCVSTQSRLAAKMKIADQQRRAPDGLAAEEG
jgi:hypothetical protein